MIRPFAIVTISNTVLAISAAVVLGISAYVEHTVSPIPVSFLKERNLISDRNRQHPQLDIYLRCIRRSFHPCLHPRHSPIEGDQANRLNAQSRSRIIRPLMGILVRYVILID